MKRNNWDLIGIIGFGAAVLIGAYSVIKSGGPGSVLIAIAMVVVFGSMGFFLYKLIWRPRMNTRRLQKTGIHGKAKILEIRETNISIHNNPQVKLILEVKNDTGNIYPTSCKVVIPRLKPGLYKTGMEIPVIIDPKNEKNVIIDTKK